MNAQETADNMHLAEAVGSCDTLDDFAQMIEEQGPCIDRIAARMRETA